MQSIGFKFYIERLIIKIHNLIHNNTMRRRTYHLFLGDDTEVGIGAVEERLCLFAGKSKLGVRTAESVLTEDGSVTADEGVLQDSGDGASIVLYRAAQVEDVAVVGDVGVVPEGAALAGEGAGGLSPEDVQVAVGEAVVLQLLGSC